jgi:PAS domain S-box-containing protein
MVEAPPNYEASAVPEPVLAALEQRARNARLFTSALTLCTLAGTFVALALGGNVALVLFLGVVTACMGLSYLFARHDRLGVAILLTGAIVFVEHIGAVRLSGALGPIPFIAPLVILMTAATSRARALPFSFAACLLVLGIEARLSPGSAGDHQAIATAALYASLVFVVSLLHVRGTERAFAIAARQDAARAAAAAAAVESERRYRLIADSADDLIALVSAQGEALYLSPSHERVLGLEVAAAMGHRLAERLNFDNPEQAAAAFEEARRTGQSRAELRLRRADGKPRILEAHLHRVDGEPGQPVAIISRDVTERKDLEMRLLASERVEALGRLAGSVAHDFNNLLTVIVGSAELARGALAPEHAARENLEALLTATSTATDLSRQLLTFSRRQLVVRSPIDVGAVLREDRELLARLVGKTVTIEYDLEEVLPRVLIARAHVEQLAINLAGNARDAMPSGGHLHVGAHLRTLRDREVQDLVAGQYVELSVRDEGTGIPADVLPHVFEPLFTTKGTHGTGLGLPTCHGIAAQAGGAIQVDSEVGRGTTFRVYLPVVDTGPVTPPSPGVQAHPRRVLVVDDDPSIRSMMARMLRSDGHEVRAASTLAEARAVVQDVAIPIDVVVTDVVLGRERGTDLVAPALAARPGLRVVVTSGYTPDTRSSEIVASSGAAFLAKPFSRDGLLRALRGG